LIAQRFPRRSFVIPVTVDPSVMAIILPSARKTAMTNHRPTDLRTDIARRELTDDQLEQVSAGHAIVSPRDAASGLPTGKRMHKPFALL
jgi:hypothetical protein